MEQIELYENQLYENLIEALNYTGISNFDKLGQTIYDLYKNKNHKYFSLEPTNNYINGKKIYYIKETDETGLTKQYFNKNTVATISVDPYFNGKENKIHIHGTIKSSSGYYCLDKHYLKKD